MSIQFIEGTEGNGMSWASKKCPICNKIMAENSRYCSMRCYETDNNEEEMTYSQNKLP